MKTLIKFVAIAAFSISNVYATTMQEEKPVIIRHRPDIIGDNGKPSKIPSNVPCPVSVTYDASDNSFYLYGNDNLQVSYIIRDEYGNELQAGTAIILNGTATITLTCSALIDGCTIELTINNQTFVGTINL